MDKVEKQMKYPIILLFLCLLVIPISLAHASSDESVNLGDVPQKLADALGLAGANGLFVGQLLASLIFMSLFLFPAMLIAGWFGGSGAVLYAIVFVGLGSSGVCVALGWFPIWIYGLTCIIVALMFAGKMRGWITGSGDRGD